MCCKRNLECIYTPSYQHHDKSPPSTGPAARYRAQDGVFPTVTSLPASTTGVNEDYSHHLAFSWAPHVPEPNPVQFPQTTMHIDDMRPPKRHCAMYEKLDEVREETASVDTVSRDSRSSSGQIAADLLQSRMVTTSEDARRVSKFAFSLGLHGDGDQRPEITRLTRFSLRWRYCYFGISANSA